METFLRCYFDYFSSLPRNSLHDRRKRKNMVDYISTLIEGCSAEESNIEETAQVAIKTILQYHKEMKYANGTVCKMGKYHNILYVAMKLCYDWKVKDSETVCNLLREIYACENTFERIFIGAIFGHKAPHYIAGWKSDFDNQEENLSAVVYFLEKANDGGLELRFSTNGTYTNFRFIDLPIESCGRASPLKIAVQLGLPDKLLIFLRFGAEIYTENEDTTVLEHILNRLQVFNHLYPYNLVSCLQLLLRAVPFIKVIKPDAVGEHAYDIVYQKMYEKYSDLIEDGLIPPTRCGFVPPELKHLCRCAVRRRLWENHQLPEGIRSLPVPEKLWLYLDILED
ncbi:SOCS domain-containing protein stops [Leptinotarsa decemlineata]|uniref:SOCS domain-containing protein stops n=1 Tax=Leptinotarsa decemlineata TaxID=7539 RepID=UPI003D30C6D4